jgi:hypothetical protein
LRFENCSISRFDAHQSFWNATLINTTVGHTINVVGGGTFNCIGVNKLAGGTFMALRGDYGATFRGDMNIIDCNYLNHPGYNSNRGGAPSTAVNSSGTIIAADFNGNNSGYRTPAQRQASYDAEYAKVYAEKMDAYADDIALGNKTREQAEADAAAAAHTAGEKMAMQGGYWLWDFGYDCYLGKNVVIDNFTSYSTNVYVFPTFKDEVFEKTTNLHITESITFKNMAPVAICPDSSATVLNSIPVTVENGNGGKSDSK